VKVPGDCAIATTMSAGLQWQEELSALLRAKDRLRDLPAGHAGLGVG
jgi:hypothetical protein